MTAVGYDSIKYYTKKFSFCYYLDKSVGGALEISIISIAKLLGTALLAAVGLPPHVQLRESRCLHGNISKYQKYKE